MSKPFLNWAGRAERAAFDVPTLPLFVHERLSTAAILETLRGHKRDRQLSMEDLFGETTHSVTDQVLRAYEFPEKWVNRLILGDSLVVMNSLIQFENLAGGVQMVYFDPPYGISYKSNFQPFVRKREVAHGDDDDMTREPETVRAYRDTWTLGIHSWLTYLRDRILLAHELLAPSGSFFLQINDENLSYARQALEDVFGKENFVVTFLVKKKGSQRGSRIDPVNDYVLWIAKDKNRIRFQPVFEKREMDGDITRDYKYIEFEGGDVRLVSDLKHPDETDLSYTERPDLIARDFPGGRLFAANPLTSGGFRRTQSVLYSYNGRTYDPGIKANNCWKHSAITDDGKPSGMDKLASASRLFVGEKQLRFKRYLSDFAYQALSNWWDGLGGAGKPVYAVQTNEEIVKRCMLMTTDPGDLVLDITCGSGTTAVVAEEWGRRWITTDISRVPIALARQRLLTRTYDYYELTDDARGPSSGFVYRRKQNRRGEETGGIVPHITSSTIANDEPPVEEVLVDRPEKVSGIVRVTGPFVVEASIPQAMSWDDDGGVEETGASGREDGASYLNRMLRILKSSPTLSWLGGGTVTLSGVRPIARSLALHAEATVPVSAPAQNPTLADVADEASEIDGAVLPGLTQRPVAISFGPENGTVTERLVYEAAREAYAKSFTHLYVIGFAIEPHARLLVEQCAQAVGVSASYLQVTMDVTMGDLLKNMRSSQLFSVCALPDVTLRRQGERYTVDLNGLDTFDAATHEHAEIDGDDVPAWFLDTNYNGLVFHVDQAFFPRTGAWEDLKNELRREFEPSVWAHLSGTTSALFDAGDHRTIAVKVIDDRGNELIVVKKLEEAAVSDAH